MPANVCETKGGDIFGRLGHHDADADESVQVREVARNLVLGRIEERKCERANEDGNVQPCDPRWWAR